VNYAELTAAVESTIGNPFAPTDMINFTVQAEEKIYNAVQIPALRKNQMGVLTMANPYLSLPTDFLYNYSLAVVEPVTGEYFYALNKDVNYLRDMFPNPTEQGRPRAYAQFDADTFILAPTPDFPYEVELHYGFYPESISTAGTSWLGDNFEGALFNGVLMEAARFIKEEQDVIAIYQQMFTDSMVLLKQLGDGKLRQDTFRTPQVKDTVR